MKRIIAATDADTRFSDSYDALKDDFNYLLDGLEKLERENAVSAALKVMGEVSRSVNIAISQVAKSLPAEQ